MESDGTLYAVCPKATKDDTRFGGQFGNSLRGKLAVADDIVQRLVNHVSPCNMSGEAPCVRCQGASEIQRLRVELEQTKLNLQQARTGRALRDLEQERQDRQRVEQSLIQTIARLCMDARDLRAHNEQLEQQLAARRTPTVRIDVDHETAAQKIADINRTIDRIFDELNAKDHPVETES